MSARRLKTAGILFAYRAISPMDGAVVRASSTSASSLMAKHNHDVIEARRLGHGPPSPIVRYVEHDALVAETAAGREALRKLGDLVIDLEKRLAAASKPRTPKPQPSPLCMACGKAVEPERRDFALPHCFACLAPPEPLPVRPFPDPKPQPAAPVEAEGWYALMYEGDTFLGIGVRGSEVSSRENAVRGKNLRGGEGEIVRILPDGAHEAAIAKAREEGAAAALHDARRTLLDLADDFTGDHAQGLRHAVRVIHDKIKAAKEAGKVGG